MLSIDLTDKQWLLVRNLCEMIVPGFFIAGGTLSLLARCKVRFSTTLCFAIVVNCAAAISWMYLDRPYVIKLRNQYIDMLNWFWVARDHTRAAEAITYDIMRCAVHIRSTAACLYATGNITISPVFSAIPNLALSTGWAQTDWTETTLISSTGVVIAMIWCLAVSPNPKMLQMVMTIGFLLTLVRMVLMSYPYTFWRRYDPGFGALDESTDEAIWTPYFASRQMQGISNRSLSDIPSLSPCFDLGDDSYGYGTNVRYGRSGGILPAAATIDTDMERRLEKLFVVGDSRSCGRQPNITGLIYHLNWCHRILATSGSAAVMNMSTLMDAYTRDLYRTISHCLNWFGAGLVYFACMFWVWVDAPNRGTALSHASSTTVVPPSSSSKSTVTRRVVKRPYIPPLPLPLRDSLDRE